MRKLITFLSAAGLLLSLTGTVVAAPSAAGVSRSGAHRADNHPGPLTARQEARRKAAQELILSGKASPNEDGVISLVSPGEEEKYFLAELEGTAQIFTILAEFGDQGSGRLGTVPGPLHNEIPMPNRQTVDGETNPVYDPSVPYDNFRHWFGDVETGISDFERSYYLDLFFGGEPSFADFYDKQSGGSYQLEGDVSDWVTVPGNASTYGDNAVEDFGGAWQFIEDAGNAWFAAALADLGSVAAVQAYLADFDVWDRYDWDDDGNFNEPDGYLDHFQAVHAGEGEDAGGGAQGADAIWSHRWYVNATDFGLTGPDGGPQFGGAEIGNTGFWIGDYTVEAENGGLGVFAHEFAHDLGLPDFYDTNAGENGTAFWTLMSSGSWLGDGTEDIGTEPNYMGPWEKLQLGWLDIADVVSTGESLENFSLEPSEAVIVDVPDEALSTPYTNPAGGHAWWTGSADDLITTLTLNQTLNLQGLRSATLTAKVWYDIEAGYDYLYAEYSNDGVDWTQIGVPLDGSSNGRWARVRYTIPGGDDTTYFRFRYQTDGGVHLPGAFIDDITIKNGGATLFGPDDVEGDPLWTPEGEDGFKISTGTEEVIGDRYYIAENRTYVGYDENMETGPYQFSFALTDPDKVEHFVQSDGLLIWLVDETYTDNNNSQHPGHGLALPVDAHFETFRYSDGTRPSNRRQPFDAPFGTQATYAGPNFDPEDPTNLDPFGCEGLHKQVVVGHGPSQSIDYLCAWPGLGTGNGTLDARATFTDTSVNAYWDATNAQNSTKVSGHGVVIHVDSQVTEGSIVIDVTNPT